MSLCMGCAAATADAGAYCGRCNADCRSIADTNTADVAGAAFADFFQDLRLNYRRSPWTRHQNLGGMARQLSTESLEVLEAIGTGDLEHVGEELMDVMWNTVLCVQALEEAGGPPLAQLLVDARQKLRRRKPWIFDPAADQPTTPAEEQARYTANKREVG